MSKQTRTITVKYSDPPAQGKKQATVKDTEGNIYGYFPDSMQAPQVGQTYEVDFTSREYNGRTYHTLKDLRPAGGQPQATQGQSTANAGQPQVSNNRDMKILVQGLAQALISSGQPLTQESLHAACNIVTNVVQQRERGVTSVDGGNPQQQQSAPPSDEIPF
jgi:hypothetical protein